MYVCGVNAEYLSLSFYSACVEYISTGIPFVECVARAIENFGDDSTTRSNRERERKQFSRYVKFHV